MLSYQLHYGVCALLGIAGVAAILFGLKGGRRIGVAAPFIIGGLALVLYGGSFGFVQRIARYGEIIRVAESRGQASERTQFVRKVERAGLPVAAIEPVAVLLLALGFGGLARASDAKAAASGGVLTGEERAAADTLDSDSGDDDFGDSLLEGEPVRDDAFEGEAFDADDEIGG